MRFSAAAIRTIRSVNVATFRTLCDKGDEIVLTVPDDVQCKVRVEGSVLIIEGTGGDVQGPIIMSRTLNARGGMGSIVEIQVPRARSEKIRTENHHS